MRVLIIEDEAPAYRRLSNLLAEGHPELEIIDVLDSVTASIKWLRNHNSPDLIFSDIQLADGVSFEIYKQVEVSCPIIFTTAYNEFMLEAFQTNGIDYLLKPIEKESLKRSIEKFMLLKESGSTSTTSVGDLIHLLERKEKRYKTRFLVKIGQKLVPIHVDNIAYFKSSMGSSDIILSSGKNIALDLSLDELQSLINPEHFFRVNRQYLANISSVDSIHIYSKGKLKVELKPETEEMVLISRDKARSFKSWIDGETLRGEE
jgi:DNA-binding LytR/AlgR family response regulator